MPNRNAAHSALVRSALQHLAMHGYTAWPTPTGGVPVEFKNGRESYIKYGKTGGGDITGILSPSGRHFEAEAKTGNAVQRKSQKLHQKFIVERNGGIYIIFYSVDDLLKSLIVAGYPPNQNGGFISSKT